MRIPEKYSSFERISQANKLVDGRRKKCWRTWRLELSDTTLALCLANEIFWKRKQALNKQSFNNQCSFILKSKKGNIQIIHSFQIGWGVSIVFQQKWRGIHIFLAIILSVYILYEYDHMLGFISIVKYVGEKLHVVWIPSSLPGRWSNDKGGIRTVFLNFGLDQRRH